MRRDLRLFPGGYLTNIYTGRLRPEVQPLTFYIPFFAKKVALSYTLYSRLSLNGHLYKTDTSVKRTLRVGPCLSLLLLFDSL